MGVICNILLIIVWFLSVFGFFRYLKNFKSIIKSIKPTANMSDTEFIDYRWKKYEQYLGRPTIYEYSLFYVSPILCYLDSVRNLEIAGYFFAFAIMSMALAMLFPIFFIVIRKKCKINPVSQGPVHAPEIASIMFGFSFFGIMAIELYTLVTIILG